MNDIQETCQKNATSALLVGRKDLVQVLCDPFSEIRIFLFEQVVFTLWLWFNDSSRYVSYFAISLPFSLPNYGAIAAVQIP